MPNQNVSTMWSVKADFEGELGVFRFKEIADDLCQMRARGAKEDDILATEESYRQKIETACNAYDKDQETIKALVEAVIRTITILEKVPKADQPELVTIYNRTIHDTLTPAAVTVRDGLIGELRAALKLAKPEMTTGPEVGSLEEGLAFEHKRELAEAETHPATDELDERIEDEEV